MSKINLNKAITIIFIAVIVFGVTIFSAFAYSWQRYERAAFDPFTAALDSLDMQKDAWVEAPGNVYTYRELEAGGYVYTVARPPFLRFNGNLSVITPSEVDFLNGEMIYLSECIVSLTYHPRVRSYVLNIADLTSVTDGSVNHLGSAVDRDGKPMSRHPDDSEEFYQEWLSLYYRFNEPIMEMFDTIKELFGEEAFR